METISVFDIIKVGIGPSSSHTMGPWRAAQLFCELIEARGLLETVTSVRVSLFGSLALTGLGHGTDVAIALGLSGEDYTKIDTNLVPSYIDAIKQSGEIDLSGKRRIPFSYASDIVFERGKTLPRHPNAMRFEAFRGKDALVSEEYFSIGGGFILVGDKEGTSAELARPLYARPLYACQNAAMIERYCRELQCSVSNLVWRNEEAWRSETETRETAVAIWQEILDCVYRGVSRSGILAGGLGVKRRAKELNQTLLKHAPYHSRHEWLELVRKTDLGFTSINKWISCFALAVSEENASFGRVVTSPTNGAAGVIPAVLMYGYCFEALSESQIVDFLLVAGEIGTLFKKNATISGAMGGCQAEIGVSSAMAAAGLAQCRNGTPGQVLMAAEIAMEHHLGMTCDPIGGLVQIPCIERNSMGAIKAITAANIAMESDPESARIRLDDVIDTMWQTAQDMSDKYKETSLGGLAANISVRNSEC